MTDQEIIKAVAELDGWVTPALDCTTIPPHTWTNKSDGCCYATCPPYLTSRDAIIPVIEKSVFSDIESQDDSEGAANFQECLRDILKLNHLEFDDVYVMARFQVAPAHQLCEALLRATGRWKD